LKYMSRKQEMQLRDKELLEEAQAIGGLGGWELNLVTGELYWTEETYRLHDTSPEEFNPTVDAGVSFFLPESKERIEKALDRAIQHGEGYDLFLSTYTTKGRLIYVRTTCRVTKNRDGVPVRLTGIFQDITQVRELEQVLHSYKNGLDQHALVSITNSAGKITYVNELLCDISGYSVKELLGSDQRLFISDVHTSEFFEEMNATLSSGEIWKNEVCYLSKSGKRFWLDNTIVPLKDAGGFIHQYMSIGADITSKKEAEAMLLESQRLSAMGEMAASVAHDFNNSLQAIIGNIEVAKLKVQGSEEAKEYLNLIEEIAFNVKDRVKSLQSFGLPNQGTSTTVKSFLNKIIQQAVAELRPLWKDKAHKEGRSISVTLDFCCENAQVAIQPGDLKNVIYNLLKNAVESIDSAGKVHIYTELSDSVIKVHFKDTGCGMTKEVREKAFTPFYSTKSYETGRGHQEHSSITTDTSAVRRLKVLWVEDDTNIGENARFLIEALGHDCLWVASALDALEAVNSSSYDLILSDIGMADMNGLEFRKELLRLKSTVPFVVVSGWELPEEDIEQYKIQGLLTKPFNLRQLKSLLSEIDKRNDEHYFGPSK
jgi:PAS domain S-box-containing protein